MSDANNRREFLQASLAAGATAGLAAMAEGAEDAAKGLPTRPLGKTGEKVSILCLGGWHIGSVKDEKEAIRIMHAAIDERHDLLRQRLGLPRRRQRGDHGQGPRRRPASARSAS